MEPGDCLADEPCHEDERWVSWGRGAPRNFFVYQHIPAHVKEQFPRTKLDPFNYASSERQHSASSVENGGGEETSAD